MRVEKCLNVSKNGLLDAISCAILKMEGRKFNEIIKSIKNQLGMTQE